MCGASLDVFLLSAQLQHWREEKQQLMTLFCCKLQSRNTPGITELGQTYCMNLIFTLAENICSIRLPWSKHLIQVIVWWSHKIPWCRQQQWQRCAEMTGDKTAWIVYREEPSYPHIVTADLLQNICGCVIADEQISYTRSYHGLHFVCFPAKT